MKASAFVVGPPDGPGAALMDMARGLGFEAVLPYAGMVAADQQAMATPLCFFLFAAVQHVGTLRAHAEAVRFCQARKLRFAPLIYFSESPSLDVIRQCIDMGFDDVITLPFIQARVEERLSRQIGQPKVFFETPGYFGPDRRSRIEGSIRPFEQKQSGAYRRIEIIRSALHGVSVLRDDHYAAA